VHIYDLAAAHLAVLRAMDSSARHIYNLGNGTGFSVREVIATAARIQQKSAICGIAATSRRSAGSGRKLRENPQ